MTEKEFLEQYNSADFKNPIVVVDVVIFTIIDGALHVLIVQRAEHPYQKMWSLVGGFVDTDKDKNIQEAAKRKLKEKTSVKAPYLEQFFTVGNKTRDPRCFSITTVYFALLPHEKIKLHPGVNALDIRWSRVEKGKIKEKLAFDHAEILFNCADRLRNKALYTSLPAYLMPESFTLSELQKVYEIILGESIQHKSFRRRILNAGILQKINLMKEDGRRPAQLYRLKHEKTHFFTRNLEGVST